MKKLQGMKNDFSSLENKKLSNLSSITGGRAETNIRTTSETGPNGQPGNTGDTAVCNDGKQVGTITVD
ncbi:grasp-with-spasm system A modified peptide [Chryseobacterium antibioticum]|uniref:Grasp-with-spasm system A modified peptide n=1 Tax=Chryseobacterium pyrolae TaxID=2987481 RepID=A0ABT2IEH4_9FLAO|nr:grasp-with-spasm system A modified peptide [Chryseobacterium pyrolae]MCT2407030.1 grasp-with-spasm system A modified peptide [Chryseobacterium pyrolae]